MSGTCQSESSIGVGRPTLGGSRDTVFRFIRLTADKLYRFTDFQFNEVTTKKRKKCFSARRTMKWSFELFKIGQNDAQAAVRKSHRLIIGQIPRLSIQRGDHRKQRVYGCISARQIENGRLT